MNTILSTQVQNRVLTVQWQDGHASQFAFDWLRDNCACPQCRHASGQKLFNINDFDEQLGLTSATLSDKGLALTWSDSHATLYSEQWLNDHDLHPDSRRKRQVQRREVVLWGASLGRSFPTADWPTLNQSTATEAKWLDGFLRYGFGLLTGIPNEEGMVATIGDRLGYVRVTNYGRLFDVRSVPDPNNLADTALGLSVHSDNPYWPMRPEATPCWLMALPAQSNCDKLTLMHLNCCTPGPWCLGTAMPPPICKHRKRLFQRMPMVASPVCISTIDPAFFWIFPNTWPALGTALTANLPPCYTNPIKSWYFALSLANVW
jgi:DUF971 family protein